MWVFDDTTESVVMLDELIAVYSISEAKSYTLFHRMFQDAVAALRTIRSVQDFKFDEAYYKPYKPISKGVTGTEYGDMCRMLLLWNSLAYIDRIHLSNTMLNLR